MAGVEFEIRTARKGSHIWILNWSWWNCFRKISRTCVVRGRLWGSKRPCRFQLAPSASCLCLRMWALSFGSSTMPACCQAPCYDGHGLNLWNCKPPKNIFLFLNINYRGHGVLSQSWKGLREQQAFFYKTNQGAAATEKATSHLRVTTETVHVQREKGEPVSPWPVERKAHRKLAGWQVPAGDKRAVTTIVQHCEAQSKARWEWCGRRQSLWTCNPKEHNP